MGNRKLPAFAAAWMLAFVSIACYFGAINSEFVSFDDPVYVTESPAVAAGLSPQSLIYAWTTFDLGNWIPLTWMSLELDSTLFGINAGAFHRTNVLLHALNVVLLFTTLARMTGRFGCSAAVALLFAVHPLHVESVAWVSERKDVLSTLFLIGAIWAYERYALRPKTIGLVQVAVMMALGLLAKPMLVTLPVLLLLLDLWPLNRLGVSEVEGRYPRQTIKTLLQEKIPLLVLAFAAGVMAIIAQSRSNAVVSFQQVSLPFRIGNAVQSYGWYLWKTILPFDLCCFYEYPYNGLPWGFVFLSAAFLTLITVFVLRSQDLHGPRQFGWAWFLLSFLPVIGLLQVGVQAHADRYAYVPHIGLFVMVVWEVDAWRQRWKLNPGWGIGLLLAVSTFLSVQTVRQVAVWHDSVSLWSAVLDLHPYSSRANHLLGRAYFDHSELDLAEKHLKQALIEPINPRTLYTLGLVHEKREEWDAAIECYRWLLRIEPGYALVSQRLSELESNHPTSEEKSTSAHAHQHGDGHNHDGHNHDGAKAELKAGLVAARRGDMRGAIRHFQEASMIDPTDADAHNNAAMAFSELKRFSEATSEQRLAVKLAPNNPDFHVNLGVLLESVSPTEAIDEYESALRLRPHDVEAQRRLQLLLRRTGKKKR